jgi:hypothetical protein
MGWEVYPDGLHGILTRLHRDYTGDTADHRDRERHGLGRPIS